MITREKFISIDTEVKESVAEIFDFIQERCVEHRYILYLANAELDKSISRFNPYTIDNQIDGYKDESRQNFFLTFMRNFYSFPPQKNTTDDNEYRLTMELMIYTHLWEAKPFLKQLYRLARLSNLENYPWSVTVPESSRHDFIRYDIRDIFKKNNLKIAKIMTDGFHSSLRNAFAHSEYQFDKHQKKIHLDTFKRGTSWDIENITYDAWSVRFVYSALLSYHLFKEKHHRKKSLIENYGKDEFLIVLPIDERSAKVVSIYFEQDFNRFGFYKI